MLVIPVQSIHYKGVCSYPAHLFMDVLAKVGYVKNSTAIVEVCINEVLGFLARTARFVVGSGP